jgi:phosphoribosylamine---glycine ligase
MKLLVVGSGGREHALAWKLAQADRVQVVYVAPGNGGTALEPNLENLAITDIHALADFAVTEHIYLTVVGPETPLAAGIVDVFRARGLKIFGPTREAAQLESSKDFAKAFMQRHGIPTAEYQTFGDAVAAHAYVDQKGAPIVIKADGLAAGKGVVVAMTAGEAHAAIDMMLLDNKMGDAGARVVIEEFLTGEEASFIVMVDGQHVLPLATSQDHKRLLDGDQGPNTGGMGAYSPAPVVTPKIHAEVMRHIIMPTVQGMAKDGIPFTGFLYAGLMIDANGHAKTLEFNCRMGDPETQPIMLRLKSDLLEIFEHAVAGTLDTIEADWDRRTALGVVMAAHNYPETPRKGDIIIGLPKPKDADEVSGAAAAAGADAEAVVFHAGTVKEGGAIRTAGGRVLCVTALGDSAKMAQKRAYETLEAIRFDGMQFRTDIGHRAIALATAGRVAGKA